MMLVKKSLFKTGLNLGRFLLYPEEDSSRAKIIGAISGIYSSPFVAVPLLVLWDKIVRAVKN